VIASDTADWDMCSRSAAARMVPVSATSTKTNNWRIVYAGGLAELTIVTSASILVRVPQTRIEGNTRQ
jgi:hypothetical protein